MKYGTKDDEHGSRRLRPATPWMTYRPAMPLETFPYCIVHKEHLAAAACPRALIERRTMVPRLAACLEQSR